MGGELLPQLAYGPCFMSPEFLQGDRLSCSLRESWDVSSQVRRQGRCDRWGVGGGRNRSAVWGTERSHAGKKVWLRA